MASVSGEIQIWSRVLENSQHRMTPEVARDLLGVSFDTDDNRRRQELNDQNQEGTLTADESEELNTYRRVGSFIDLFHTFAKRRLETYNQ